MNETTRLPSSTPPAPRRAKDDDLPHLRALDQEIFGGLAYPYFVLRQLYDVHGTHFLVADSPAVGEALCGYAMVAVEPGCGTAWLLGLGVRAGHRRRGLGGVLMTAALDMCRVEGVTDMRVTVHPSNEPAVHVYTKAGFSRMDMEDDYFGPGEPRLVLLRHL
ncbi:GNAT family N-acetyltransferase [Streptomyces sp. NPDC054804]